MHKKKLLFAFCALAFISNSNQLISMMEMAVMMGAQQGASIANEAVSATFQEMSDSLQNDQSTLQSSLQLFSDQLSKAEASQAKALEKIFVQSIQYVTKQEDKQSQYAEQMQDYIFKAISLHKPPFYYLISPLTVARTLDQAFTNGTMYTPKGSVWKNIFQYGDWEYDHTSDSFFQFKNVPLFSPEAN